VLIGEGDGTFGAPSKYQLPNGTFRIVAGDFTRDGRIDLATVNDSFTFRDDCIGARADESQRIYRSDGGVRRRVASPVVRCRSSMNCEMR
jgi:hypothetical protein